MNWLPLDRSSPSSLSRQIYLQLRKAILAGHLQAGERIPSTRELSGRLNISRNVVADAFDQLQAEGYIVGKHGSGTYVEERLYLSGQKILSPQLFQSSAIEEEKNLSCVDFGVGVPCLEAFPKRKWGTILKEVCTTAHENYWRLGPSEGIPELRRALVEYLRQYRNVVCEPEQVIITAGAVQALSIAARALLTSSASVLMEDPGNKVVTRIFSLAGGTVIPCAVDRYGLLTDRLPRNTNPALIFVTPSHQFPIGGHLPVQRRVELVQYSRHTGSFIIEDDYDSEFRYEGYPISSLQGLAPDNVIYIGSFSKSLFPSQRLGYLIVPASLVCKCREIKHLSDRQCPALEQLATARFILEGHFVRHIARMRKMYKAKRDHLLRELQSRFNQIEIFGASTGMHVVARFSDRVFDQALLNVCRKEGVIVYPVEERALLKGNYSDHIILGYGHLDSALISKGVERLATALR
ncbi:HTH-type transcriptional regulatory protein GabR [Sporomusa rhizae]|uniref:MocR-like pyridoxine biosynthesis transcription factor PdxR n=1 Tax=Sporomusa rhizae TaxID=357999 RepID=UPI00352A05A2